MVKETKFFRKQAAKAERMALSVSDAEISQRFLNLAKAYRSQADVLKAKKLKAKKLKAKKLKAKKPKVKKRKGGSPTEGAPGHRGSLLKRVLKKRRSDGADS